MSGWGTASGGVWHSTNGGVNWLPMSDNEPSLAIGAITLDGCDANQCAVIYVGTGEKQHPSRYLLWHGLADWADFGRRDLTIRLEPGWRRCLQICLDQQCGSGSHYDGQQQDYLT